MRTEKEIQRDILDITMEINNKFPELSKFIKEMPVTIPDKDDVGINNKNLEEYYNSLRELLTKYKEEQGK